MVNFGENIKRPHIGCIDVYGNHLMVYKNKKGNASLTLYHGDVVEGTARKDFEDISFKITSESGDVFQIIRGLYEIKGNSFVLSGDPIRDGRNFFIIEQEDENSYYMTIGRDLANDLNKPNQTNIELPMKYESLYNDSSLEPATQLVKRNKLS